MQRFQQMLPLLKIQRVRGMFLKHGGLGLQIYNKEAVIQRSKQLACYLLHSFLSEVYFSIIPIQRDCIYTETNVKELKLQVKRGIQKTKLTIQIELHLN